LKQPIIIKLGPRQTNGMWKQITLTQQSTTKKTPKDQH
jgi:hypothetical protein